MKALPAWVTYTVLRLALIAVPLVILLLLQVPWPIATIAAVLIGLCLSYLMLGRSRDAVSRDLYEARSRKRAPAGADSADEDAVDDAMRARSDATASDTPAHRDASAEAPSDGEKQRPAEEDAVRQAHDSGQFQGKD